MKKVTVLGISANQKLIIAFEGQNYLQSRFQGFQITTDVRLRHLFDELLNKQFTYQFKKSDKTFKYINQSLLINLLKSGALSINKKQLEESKIFTQEQKQNFNSLTKSNQNQSFQQFGIDLNQKSNSHILQAIIKEKKTIKAKIQYMSDIVLISFKHEDKSAFLKCKIQSYKHYFQLFPQVTFWKNKILPVDVEVKIVAQKYNILTKNLDTLISLQQQFCQILLKEGLVAMNPKNYFSNSKQTFNKLMNIQTESIIQKKGIYSAKSQMLSFLYTKNNYVGIVTDVFEGYVYEITALNAQNTIKVQLPMVTCPTGDYVGSFDCRQFARKQLIGREVNVYLQKQEGLNTTGIIVRTDDCKDVESMLLENGFALLRQQLRNTVVGQKYVNLQNQAKQKKKGIHRNDLENRRFQDLTQAPFNKQHLRTYLQRRHQILNKLSTNQAVVIEDIISSLNYKIRVQSKNILLNLRLQGAVQPCIDPNILEQKYIEEQTNRFLNRSFKRRNMIAMVTQYDQETNSFVGTLCSEKLKVDLQELLIQACVVYADKYNPVSRYLLVEGVVEKTQKLIWQPRLRCFQPGVQLTQIKNKFQGRFSWVHNATVAYIQPKDNFQTLEKLQSKIRNLKLEHLPKEKQRVGAWCISPYQGQVYRTVIKSKKNNQFTVQFIDWGNQLAVKAQQLYQLPEQLLLIQRQCIKVSLNSPNRTKNRQAMETTKKSLLNGGVYSFNKVHGNLVDYFKPRHKAYK